MYGIGIMGCRYEMLQSIVAAADKINIPFIGYNGTDLISAGISDDLGIFYFIPKIVKIFNITLDQAIAAFFYGMVSIAFIFGLTGFFLLYKQVLPRIIAIITVLVLLVISINIGDVYMAYSLSTLSIIPLFLYFIKQEQINYLFVLFLFVSGLIVGFSQIIRAFSGVGPLLFMIVLIMGSTAWSLGKRFLLLGIIGCGMLIFPLYFNVLYNQYDTFASTQLISYKKITNKHIFWHSVYLGFGFLNNNFGIRYDDSVGAHKAISIDPEAIYPSEKYEQTLKKEVFKLVKDQPLFVFDTFFAKIGVILSFLLLPARGFKGWLYFNLLIMLALILSFFYRKPLRLELAFLFAAMFNILFGIIIMPFKVYLLGFISCVMVYSIISINYALEHGLIHDIMRFFLSKKQRNIG